MNVNVVEIANVSLEVKIHVDVVPIAAANNAFFNVDVKVAHFMGHFFL